MLAILVSFGGGFLLANSGGAGELLEDTLLAKKDKDTKKDKKKDDASAEDEDKEAEDDGIDADGAGNGGLDAGAAGNGMTNTGYVDTGGTHASGTSASNSFSIKMSSLCTFSDPSGLSFDRRYVLHGGSSCTPAKRASRGGKYTCKEAYAILYTKGGKAAGEYLCYVMGSESQAQSLVSEWSGSGMTCGRWGDVVYVYSTGSYVQTSIDTYYKAGSITSATPEAYLGMGFYFGGMTEYRPSGNQNNSNNSSNPSTPDNPNTPDNPSTPDNPNTPDNPDIPDNPNNPDNPDKPDNPDNPDKPNNPVLDPVKINESCTSEDPMDIAFDTRYVLYGAPGSVAVMGESMGFEQMGIKAEINSVYQFYYAKDKKMVRAYTYYETAGEADAKEIQKILPQMMEMLGKKAEVSVKGNVAIVKDDAVQSTIDGLAGNKLISEATPDAYVAFMLSTGYVEYKAPDDSENAVKIDGWYTAKDPTDIAFDTRYVLYGAPDSPAVAGEVMGFQYMGINTEIKGIYKILFAKDGKTVRANTYYVTPGEADAEEMRQTLPQMLQMMGSTAKVSAEKNLVVTQEDEIQKTIDGMAGNGLISEATAEAYIKFLMNPATNGYTEFNNPSEKTIFTLRMTEQGSCIVQSETLPEEEGRPEEEGQLAEIEAAEEPQPEERATEEPAEGTDLPEAGDAESEEPDNFDPDTAGSVEGAPGNTEDISESTEDTSGNIENVSENTEDTQGSTEDTPDGEDAAKDQEDVQIPFDPSKAGSVTNGDAADKDADADETQRGGKDLVITAGYHYQDPENLAYDERFVFHGGADSALAQVASEEKKAAVSEVYVIYYMKDQEAAAEFRCYVINEEVVCEETKKEDLQTPAGYREFMKEEYGLTEATSRK